MIGRSVLRLRESKDDCEWAIEHNGSNDEKQTEAALRDYLSLHVTPSLSELYTTWSKDANFAKVAQPLQGVRVLRQDPFECLISFICSSNNQVLAIALCLSCRGMSRCFWAAAFMTRTPLNSATHADLPHHVHADLAADQVRREALRRRRCVRVAHG